MKRMLFIVGLVFVVISINAQVRSTATKFSAKNYYEYTGVTGDTILDGTTDCNIDFVVPRQGLYFYRVEVELDEISGSSTCISILQGSLNGNDFTEIDTLADANGTEALSSDGTVSIQDVSTGVMWRYLRLVNKNSTTGKWDVNYVRFRAVGKNEE